MIMKLKNLGILLASVLALSACTRVETGNVGVVRNFNGVYSEQVADVGFHLTILDSITSFTIREIPIQLNDLKPQTKNNGSILSDLDISIQYSVAPEKVAKLAIKYKSMHHQMKDTNVVLPAYELVLTQARSATATAVAQFDALEIASKREELEKMIEQSLQRDLDSKDPNTFIISRVTVSNLLPDEKILASIRAIAESNNRKQVAINELDIAKTKAEENRIKSQTLDERILAEKQLEAMVEMGRSGNVIVVPVDFKGIIQAKPSRNTSPTPSSTTSEIEAAKNK